MGSLEDLQKLQASLERAKKKVEYKINCLKEKMDPCDHDYVIEFPSGPRDNNEFYYTCTKCNKSY